MKRHEMRQVHLDQGDLHASISLAFDRDAYDLFIWRRSRGEKGAYVIQFGKDGLLEEEFVPENEPAPRASLSVTTLMAPIFFRLMGEAADAIGVLPDVVSAQIARLETEVKLLREMLDRADKSADAHVHDLRRAAFE